MKQVVFILFLIFSLHFSHASNKFNHNECMHKGSFKLSPNGCFKLYIKESGDFVVENVYTQKTIWSAGTSGPNFQSACLRRFGNFEVVNDWGENWQSKTHYFYYGLVRPNPSAQITDEGRFEVRMEHKSFITEKSECFPIKDYSGWTFEELEEEKSTLKENIKKLNARRDAEKIKKLEENIEKNKIELEKVDKEYQDLKSEINSEKEDVFSLQWQNVKPELVKLRGEKLKSDQMIDVSMNQTSKIVQKIIDEIYKGREPTTTEVDTTTDVTDVEVSTENSDLQTQTPEEGSGESDFMDADEENQLF